MKARLIVGVLIFASFLAAVTYFTRKRDALRRHSLATLERLDHALSSGDVASVLDVIVLPPSIQHYTTAEQAEFVAKALRDEISPEGLAILRREGQFGPLTNVFPAEAEQWAKQAGVKPEDCVAFKLERNGLRAEVVLVRDSPLAPRPAPHIFRIVRCNNVK